MNKQVMSQESILRTVWENGYFLIHKTKKAHSGLRKKAKSLKQLGFVKLEDQGEDKVFSDYIKLVEVKA